jgi:hypothetical protein
MAKATPELWAQAKALFEAGKSFREIDEATGINYKSVERASKKDVWQKGILSQLIIDKVRIDAKIVTLEQAQKDVVTKEVAERLKHIEFFTKAGLKVASMAIRSMGDEPTPTDCKVVSETLINTMKVSGVVPYYNTPTTINNTNAIQSTHDSVRSEIINRVLSIND